MHAVAFTCSSYSRHRPREVQQRGLQLRPGHGNPPLHLGADHSRGDPRLLTGAYTGEDPVDTLVVIETCDVCGWVHDMPWPWACRAGGQP